MYVYTVHLFITVYVCCVCVVQVIQAGMFDQKSTTSERKAFLEALLEEEAIEYEVCDENLLQVSFLLTRHCSHTVLKQQSVF